MLFLNLTHTILRLIFHHVSPHTHPMNDLNTWGDTNLPHKPWNEKNKLLKVWEVGKLIPNFFFKVALKNEKNGEWNLKCSEFYRILASALGVMLED